MLGENDDEEKCFRTNRKKSEKKKIGNPGACCTIARTLESFSVCVCVRVVFSSQKLFASSFVHFIFSHLCVCVLCARRSTVCEEFTSVPCHCTRNNKNSFHCCRHARICIDLQRQRQQQQHIVDESFVVEWSLVKNVYYTAVSTIHMCMWFGTTTKPNGSR